MSIVVAGIDPGKDGAIAIIRDGKVQKKDLLRSVVPKLWLLESGCTKLYIEKAQVMGKESARSMFSYGREYGYLLGTLHDCGIDINFVPPAVWTAKLHKKSATTFDNPKQASLYVARQLWPHTDFRATDRSRVPHDGIVDACLIAYYGWLNESHTGK